MYDKPPSRAQLRYLKNLGYADHPGPQSMAEASAAIDEMLDSGDCAAAYHEILVERRQRELLYSFPGGGRGCDPIINLLFAPLLAFGYLASAVFWLVSRFIGLIGWMAWGIAASIIWILSRAGLLARRSAVATAEAGREKVIPWLGAQDWRGMAKGCGVQLAAGARRVDCLLAGASGEDRALHQILRFAVVAAGAVGLFAVALVVFK